MRTGNLKPEVGPDDHAAGPDDAPVTLVEYGDFECPYCGRAHPIVHAIREQLGAELRFVFRHFPMTEVHPHAQHAAEAAEAAAEQGRFWEMHDALFSHQRQLDDDDLIRYGQEIGLDTRRVQAELEAGAYTQRVRDDFRSGVRSGVNGTPTFFLNGHRFDGDWTDRNAFVQALKDAAAERSPVR
ncbi:MAG: DsbA family protein [Longimicrobiales bacterium]